MGGDARFFRYKHETPLLTEASYAKNEALRTCGIATAILGEATLPKCSVQYMRISL